MSSGQARCLAQEEQLGPAMGPYDDATNAAPVKSAHQPRSTRPATFEQRAGLWIMDDAPISSKAERVNDFDTARFGIYSPVGNIGDIWCLEE